jgi:predicted chitinase
MTPSNPLLAAAKIKDHDKWLQPIIETCAEFEINTPQRIAAFLAQTSHEFWWLHHADREPELSGGNTSGLLA